MSGIEQKYVIARTPSPPEAEHSGDTFTVVWQSRENLSHHETEAEARAAIRRYEAADKRRRS